MNAVQLIHQSKSVQWFTPAPYIDAARRALGGIDLDPASCEEANKTIRALRYFTEQEDGLGQSWYGRVFCNPPYGGAQVAFTKKMIEEHDASCMSAGILLVKAATDTRWFQPLWDYPLCFTAKRIRFGKPSEVVNRNRPSIGNVFVYLGPEPQRFYAEFARFGRCGVLRP
ncbi:MAG: DNA N-6-adenine-methyltransferase [Gammaproteobacteria bacterium]